ncbi:MAG: hypothetical protein MRY83_13745 [Flavobacteriales bacterium]|nr:hypothetical protein [Flavobacteriales bacterium]
MNQLNIQQKAFVDSAWKNIYKLPIFSLERQKAIDLVLEKDSSIAWFWQQKAMPLYKQRKYELGQVYLNKAVTLNPDRWLEYSGFMECLFSKNPSEALLRLDLALEKYGNRVFMDHSTQFWRALSYIQLNEFDSTETILSGDIQGLMNDKGEDWVHHLDLFYLGIAQLELEKFQEAEKTFDWALQKYPKFSDIWFYKYRLAQQEGDTTLAKLCFEKAEDYAKQGYTINEDNIAYEPFPYQVNWDYPFSLK